MTETPFALRNALRRRELAVVFALEQAAIGHISSLSQSSWVNLNARAVQMPPSPASSTLRRPPSSYPTAALPRRKPKGRFSSPLFRVGLPFLAFVTLSSYILARFLDDQFAQQRKQQQWTEVEKKVKPTKGAGGEGEKEAGEAAVRSERGVRADYVAARSVDVRECSCATSGADSRANQATRRSETTAASSGAD